MTPDGAIFSMLQERTSFHTRMSTSGVAHLPGVLDAESVAALRIDSDAVQIKRRAIQAKNGVAGGMEGTAHHVLGEGGSLDALISDLPLWDLVAAHFGGKFILLNYGVTLHPPGSAAYTIKPHRDVRAWTWPYRLSLNMLVMLDDFTIENGATVFLPGSHAVETMPSPDEFATGGVHMVGQAGDIVLFDSLVVHAAAPNRSTARRRALTLCFGRPFMKPQMDWPRFLPADAEAGLTPCARQLLGYDARVAASLDEFYQPADRWVFKADQR